MKKTMAWLLTALMVLSLLGCGGGSSTGATENTGTPAASGAEDAAGSSSAVAESKNPAEPPAVEKPQSGVIVLPPAPPPPADTEGSEKVRYVVGTELLEETIRAEDGTRLAEARYHLPVLTAVLEEEEADVPITEENATTDLRKNALAVTAAFSAGFDVWRQGNELLKEYAHGDYAQRPEMFREMGMYFADELEFTSWQTDGLVSIRGKSYSYYGGAHPNSLLPAWNFDLNKGEFITPLALAADETEFRTVVAEELKVLAEERAKGFEIVPTDLYWEDYAAILQNWCEGSVSFDTAGMTVSYPPYELGSYAAGAHEFTISYAFLEPHLSEYGRELLGLTGS